MLRRLCLTSLLVLTACSPAAETAPPPAGPVEAKPAGAWTAGAMVAAANPLAVQAGLQILREGGSAVDAAIAIQAVLGLVEPQSSGLGGGAFLLHYDAGTGDVTAYDGRETAPAGATPDMFLVDGKPMDFGEAVRSGRSVGVPGVVAMLALAHKDEGRLPLARDLQPAIALAEQGFEVSQRLHDLIAMVMAYGPLPPEAANYLTTDGTTPLPFGHLLKNQAYADTLKRIAAEGPAGFYKGPVAAAIVEAVQRGNRPGTLTQGDLDAYQPRALEPLCRPYRTLEVCGMPSPSSGGLAVLMALGMLDRFDMTAAGPTAAGWHLLIEAERLAYADRDLYAADDRFVSVPTEGLLKGDYLKARAQLIQPARAMESALPGVPEGAPGRRAADPTGGWTGTSHFSIVDAEGDAVAMTTTIEAPFGSGRMAAGFFLNNELTDFSFQPTDAAGVPIANAVAPGKKPRSSMAPTLVFEDGHFRLAVGSPGGNAIIAYVLKTVVAILDWGMEPQAAIALPNVVARGKILVEPSFDPQIRAGLAAMGHEISEARAGEASGLHAILLKDGRLVGGADPRREGQARSP